MASLSLITGARTLTTEQHIQRLGLRGMAEKIADDHNVEFEVAYITKRRFKNHTAARHHLWWYMRQELRLSYPEIGRIFGCDHTTILAGIRKHVSRVDAASEPRMLTAVAGAIR